VQHHQNAADGTVVPRNNPGDCHVSVYLQPQQLLAPVAPQVQAAAVHAASCGAAAAASAAADSLLKLFCVIVRLRCIYGSQAACDMELKPAATAYYC
jgi:hypothetical protein